MGGRLELERKVAAGESCLPSNDGDQVGNLEASSFLLQFSINTESELSFYRISDVEKYVQV